MTAPSATNLSAIARNAGEVDHLPVIDLDRLATFTDGDHDLEAELSDLYQTTARRYLNAMAAALENAQAWSGEAHSLKGASGNLGASRVAVLAKEAEFEAPSPARLEVLRLAVDDVTAFFLKRRG